MPKSTNYFHSIGLMCCIHDLTVLSNCGLISCSCQEGSWPHSIGLLCCIHDLLHLSPGSCLHGSPLKQFNPQIRSLSGICSYTHPYWSVSSLQWRSYFPFLCVIFPWDRIRKESLKVGDHIYSWKAAWVYAHHGEVIRIVLLLLMLTPLYLNFDWVIGSY
jgi:hypothetical protein